MKLKILFLPFIIPIIVGCSNENLMNNLDEKSQNSDSYFIPIEEAVINAEKTFSLLYRSTRSVRTIETVNVLSSASYKETDTDDYGLYIVNYSNKKGFAILSADKRRPKVYAISDEGSLYFDDTSDTGVNWYIKEILNQENSNSTMYSQSYANDPQFPDSTSFNPLEWKTTDKVLCEPLIKGFTSQFYQGNPYNDYCLTADGKQAVTGCTPLALGTYMSYYKWPESLEGYSFNWESMLSYPYHDSWARLFETLGREKYLNATYGVKGTSVNPDNVIKTMSLCGYSNTKRSNFTTSSINSSLASKKPVLCRGMSTTDNEGHFWIIDGGHIKTETAYDDGSIYSQEIYTYYHCIWGQGGSGNGYFLYGGYTLGGTAAEPDNVYFNVATTYKNMEIFTGMTVNK